jgi:hypothetical protein
MSNGSHHKKDKQSADINHIRSCFPSIEKAVLFENAGGSQLPNVGNVIVI